MRKKNDWTARVLLLVPRVVGSGKNEQTVAVFDKKKQEPWWWNFPGGRKKVGEIPAQTASRELKEETGLTVYPKDLLLIQSLRSTKGFPLFLFIGYLNDFSGIMEYGDEGEEVKIFNIRDLFKMDTFYWEKKGYLDDLKKSLELLNIKIG